MRWPEAAQVLKEASAWAAAQGLAHPSLQGVAVFGSYGRGTAGVGSDLDLLLIDAGAEGSQYNRLPLWPLEQLPLSCDALVFTPGEFDVLMASDQRMAKELRSDARWIWQPTSSSSMPPLLFNSSIDLR